MGFHLSEHDAVVFAERGALRIGAAVDAKSLAGLAAAIADRQPGDAGVRLQGIPALRSFLAPSGPIGGLAAAVLGEASRAVRAVFFDKTAAANWSVPWHQDRTIVVAQRRDVAGFGPWTVKSGLLHVAPPYDVLAGMMTLRLHLDAVPETNAPLLVAPGSAGLRRRTCARSCSNAERRSVVRRPATPGSMRRRSFTHPRPLPRRRIGACCRSTLQGTSFPVDCSGSAFELMPGPQLGCIGSPSSVQP